MLDKPKSKTKPAISDAEMARRREHVRIADANNRIEGLKRDPQSDAVFDAYIRGEIEATEIIAHLNALPDQR
jgi:hypothetical protein